MMKYAKGTKLISPEGNVCFYQGEITGRHLISVYSDISDYLNHFNLWENEDALSKYRTVHQLTRLEKIIYDIETRHK